MTPIILCILMVGSGLVNRPTVSKKPACKAAIRGQFWPEAANSNSTAMRKLSQCGALEICTTTTWRYKWQPLAVNVRQLGKTPQEPTAACAAVMAEFREREQ